jgi:hypothetical protein
MPFDKCIAGALKEGLIDEDQAQEFQDTYQEELNARSGSMPPHEAAAEAARETFRQIEGDAAEKRRQAFLSLGARQSIMERLDNYRSYVTGQQDPMEAAIGLYDRLLPNRQGLAVEQQHLAWLGRAHATMDEAFDTWRRNFLGVRRNQPRLQNIVREAFNEPTGDVAAKALVDGWKKSSAMLRQAFNRFGGHIGELEDWGLPQVHVREKVAGVTFNQWAGELTPRLDRSRMRTRNGARPLNDAELEKALQGVYQNIVTQGWAGKEATSRSGGGSLANANAEHRFLHFKSADDWFGYQQQYGEGDPVNAMLSHMDRRARQIGLMEVMGPNPNASLAFVKNELTRRAALMPNGGKSLMRNGAIGANKTLDNLHINYTRSNAAPTRPIVADVLHDVNNMLMSAQLGSAIIPAISGDINTQRMARSLAGLPEMKLVASYVKQLASRGNRMEAIRAGLTAQHYAQTLGNQGRFTGELFGHSWSRWMNDRVQAASGLTAWTGAGRAAFAMDFYGHVADMAERPFAMLDKDFRKTLESFGVREGDWDLIRATAPHDHGGATFIRPGDIFERQDLAPGTALDLSNKLADAAMSLQEHAVPSGSLRASASMRGSDHPGSGRAAIAGSLAMYRTFSSVVMLTHGRRMIEMGRTNPLRAASYGAGLVLGGMIAGALAIQAKEIVQGRNPRDMADWRFWLAALSAGGGLGLLGDFAYTGLQGQSRTGHGIANFFIGPPVGLLQDTVNLVTGGDPLSPAPKHDSRARANFPTRLVQFTKRYMPGNNLWYARLAMDRLVWDHVQALVDPHWQKRVRQSERAYRQNFGNGTWWHPGDNLPESGPDLETAFQPDRKH